MTLRRRRASAVQLPNVLIVRCLSWISVVDSCRVAPVSRQVYGACRVVQQRWTHLSLGGDPPFVDDKGLRALLSRCPALTEVDLDARALSDTGISILAQGVPGLKTLALYQCHRLTKGAIDTLARRSEMLRKRRDRYIVKREHPVAIAEVISETSKQDMTGMGGHGATGKGEGDSSVVCSPLGKRICQGWSHSSQAGESCDGRVQCDVGNSDSSLLISPAQLRSLCVCSLGRGLDKDEAWQPLRDLAVANQGLDCLTLVNIVDDTLPLDAIVPVFVPTVLRPPHYDADHPGGGVEREVSGEGLNLRGGMRELNLAVVSATQFSLALRGELILEGDGHQGWPIWGGQPLLSGLVHLTLIVDTITDVLCSAIAQVCTHIEELSLHQREEPSGFSDAGLCSLAQMRKLRSLTLRSDPRRGLRGCSDVGLVFVAMGLSHLECVELTGASRATDTTLAALLDNAYLRQLRLEGCLQLEGHVFIQPSVLTPQSVRRVEAISRLTRLSLSHCTALGPEMLWALISACGPCLEELDLSNCYVTDDVLPPIMALEGLKDLNLSRCPFSSSGLVVACTHTPPAPPSTRSEGLNRRCLGGQGVTVGGRTGGVSSPSHTLGIPHPQMSAMIRGQGALSEPTLPQLRRLSLAWCEGLQESLLGLAALVSSGRLGVDTRALDLAGLTSLYDKDVGNVLDKVPQLEEIRLALCSGITDGTILALTQATCSTRLKNIDLHECHGVSHDSVELFDPPSLPRLVRVSCWPVKRSAAVEMARARPNCWVTLQNRAVV